MSFHVVIKILQGKKTVFVRFVFPVYSQSVGNTNNLFQILLCLKNCRT